LGEAERLQDKIQPDFVPGIDGTKIGVEGFGSLTRIFHDRTHQKGSIFLVDELIGGNQFYAIHNAFEQSLGIFNGNGFSPFRK